MKRMIVVLVFIIWADSKWHMPDYKDIVTPEKEVTLYQPDSSYYARLRHKPDLSKLELPKHKEVKTVEINH